VPIILDPRTDQIASLHHLACCRHGAAEVGRDVDVVPGAVEAAIGRWRDFQIDEMILADSLLNVADLHHAHEALAGCISSALSLGEALELTVVQTIIFARLGRGEIDAGIAQKCSWPNCCRRRRARGCRLLALAAKKVARASFP